MFVSSILLPFAPKVITRYGFGRERFSHGSHSHRNHAGCLYQKNTDCTDAHGWVFSRILYSCSAAHCLVFDAPPAQWIGTDFSQEEGALRSEKSVEIREICGRQLSAQCAKEQAGCFYSPTDLSDKHRCHADCLSITQIAPSARQIDTDFSQAEDLSMRACFNGHAPRGQKFIAQRQAKRRPGYNVPWSLRPARAKVLKHSALCLLLPLQGVV